MQYPLNFCCLNNGRSWTKKDLEIFENLNFFQIFQFFIFQFSWFFEALVIARETFWLAFTAGGDTYPLIQFLIQGFLEIFSNPVWAGGTLAFWAHPVDPLSNFFNSNLQSGDFFENNVDYSHLFLLLITRKIHTTEYKDDTKLKGAYPNVFARFLLSRWILLNLSLQLLE